MDETYDVVVIGGGAAGLSAALTLGRARRSVLVVDAGQPRNAPAEGVHNYLGREGTAPADLYKIGRAEAEAYGARVTTGRVVRLAPGFEVGLEDGRVVGARRILLATGLRDELPDIPGLTERWGRTVLHCPYCHGWEVRDQAIGVIGINVMALHGAQLWRQWTDDVVLFRHGDVPIDAAQRERLAARGIRIVDGPVAAVEDDGVRLADGTFVPRRAIAVPTTLVPNADLLAGLGVTPEPKEVNGVVLGHYVPTEPTGATAVPGVYACGNVSDPMAQVIVAAAQGVSTAAQINADLVEEDFETSVRTERVATQSQNSA